MSPIKGWQNVIGGEKMGNVTEAFRINKLESRMDRLEEGLALLLRATETLKEITQRLIAKSKPKER